MGLEGVYLGRPNIEAYEGGFLGLGGSYAALNGQQGAGPVTARFQKTGHIKEPSNLAYAVAQAFNAVSGRVYSREKNDCTKVLAHIAQAPTCVASVKDEESHLVVKFQRNNKASPFDVLRVLSRL